MLTLAQRIVRSTLYRTGVEAEAMAVHKVGGYEIEVVRYEAYGPEDPRALLTVYHRKAFVGMGSVAVDGLDADGLRESVFCLRNCRHAGLKAVVEDARKVAKGMASGPTRKQ